MTNRELAVSLIKDDLEHAVMGNTFVKCFHFCTATQKYEFLGVVARKNIGRLMPINKTYAQFVQMSNGTMVEKYRFTELNDSTTPQI